MKLGLAFAAACIAALGNAVFVFGQRKSVAVSNPFLFTSATLCVCLILCFSFSLALGLGDTHRFWRQNYPWFTISGVGLFVIYIGFYWLFSKFGASYYTLYAMLSILTTSIILGNAILKESFNRFSLLSVLSALLSIIFFYFSKAK